MLRFKLRMRFLFIYFQLSWLFLAIDLNLALNLYFFARIGGWVLEVVSTFDFRVSFVYSSSPRGLYSYSRPPILTSSSSYLSKENKLWTAVNKPCRLLLHCGLTSLISLSSLWSFSPVLFMHYAPCICELLDLLHQEILCGKADIWL